MKKKLIVFLIALLITAPLSMLSAQVNSNFQLHLGSQHFTKNNMMPHQIVANDPNGIYVTKIKLSDELRGRETFPVLEFYNNQMELRSFRQLQVIDTKRPVTFEQIMQIGGRLYCFYSTETENSHVLMADEINKSTLTLQQSPVTLQEIPARKNTSFNQPGFHLKLSEEGNFLLATFSQAGAKNNPDELNFTVFDQGLQAQWTHQLAATTKKEHYQVINYHLSNTGDLYVLKKEADSQKALEKFWQPLYQFGITAITGGGKHITELHPSIPGKHLTKMQIGTNKAAQLVCAGFYTDTEGHDAAGSYFLTFQDQQIAQKSFKPFAPILMMESEKATKEEKEEGLYAYRLNDLTFRSDGSVVLIAEQATQTAGFNPRTNFRTARTAFNTIAVVSVDPDGEVMWTEQIRKNQVSPEGYSFFSSYATAVLNDKVYLVFNDHPENLCEGICEQIGRAHV